MTGLPLAADGDGVRLFVHVTPRARSSAVGEIVARPDGRPLLSIRVAAAPADGAANKALIALVAEWAQVRPSAVAIAAGSASRQKLVRIRGVTAAAIAARL